MEKQGSKTYTFNQSIVDKFEIDITENVNSVKKKHDYALILKSTQEKIEEYQQKFKNELSSFNNQEGIRIEISFEYSSISRSGSSRAKKWVMDSGKQSLCMHYRLLKIKTRHIKINLENLAVLQLNDWDNKNMKIVFYSPEISTMMINSENYNLSDIQELKFAKLNISGKGFIVNVDCIGQISISDKKISITYNKRN